MEHSAEPIRLELKSEKEILREKISKLKLQVKGLGATIVALAAALAINSDLGKKFTGSEEPKELQHQSLNDVKAENKDISSSYTLQSIEDLLFTLDQKIVTGEVGPEEIEDLKSIIDHAEHGTYIESLGRMGSYPNNTNPDGGTIETGGPVIGSEEVR